MTDREDYVGIRPVHVNVGETGIKAMVDLSEMMGSELHLHMKTGSEDVIAVVPTTRMDMKS